MSVPYRTDPPRRAARWPWIVGVIVVVIGAWVIKGQLNGGKVKTGSGDAHGTTVIRYDVHSKAVGRTLPQVAASPAGGGRNKPLLVFLHGKSDDGQEKSANAAFFEALAAQGDDAPNVVFPNGGNHSYWHNRSDGDWADYVLTEAIPMAIKKLHADPSRVAIGGISMGGYGAFELASEMPNGFCAVGGHSAATWVEGGQSAPGAFDDAEDFSRHDVIALAGAKGRSAWGKAKLWLDNGDSDPFLQSDASFAQELKIKQHVWKGGHDGDYWDAHYDDYLKFYAQALKNC